MQIADSVKIFLETVPPDVVIVAAAKHRTIDEVEAVIRAGITHIGQNYVQQAKPMVQALGGRAEWHMIGHLQRNKVSPAVQIFNLIETLDSARLARAIDSRCEDLGKVMLVLIEINSGRESNKTGVLPEQLDDLLAEIVDLKHIRIMGLMTMGPRFGDPEESRPYFKATRKEFDRLSAMNLPNVTMRYLSMGMSNSYQVAIEEGANIIRVGTKIFGERPRK